MTRAILTLATTACAVAGTITGTVSAHGKKGVDEDLAGDQYKSRKFKFLERIDYSEFREFVVYVDQPGPGKSGSPASNAVVVQKSATFFPHILPVLVGTTVEWPNQDDIFHNVFSFSEPKPFDLGLYKTEVKRITFDKPGRIDIFCSIHSRMHCVILVLENPLFAATNAKGIYRILNVPAGTYILKAWHERLPAESKKVNVPEVGEVTVDFVLEIKNLPKY